MRSRFEDRANAVSMRWPPARFGRTPPPQPCNSVGENLCVSSKHRRKYPTHADHEGEWKRGLHVVVRLTSARVVLQRLQWNERPAGWRRVQIIATEWRAEHRVARIVRESGRGRREQRMRVRGEIVDREGHARRSGSFSDVSPGQS